MRVLIDTNIFIYRENNKALSETMQDLMRNLQLRGDTLLTHPMSIGEIKQDKDDERKKISLTKLNTYPTLENPPNPKNDTNFIQIVKIPSNNHDKVDNAILYAVYKKAVNFLITQDEGIHKKALKLGIDDNVLTITDALTMFKLGKSPYHPPSIKKEMVYNIDFNDPIFESLKIEYPNFEHWVDYIKKAGRECYVNYKHNGLIGAIMIYKIENEPIEAGKFFNAKNRIKISTLKVASTGNKLGELFVRLAVENAIKNNSEEIYLTHYTKPEDHLVELIGNYGFFKVGVNNDGEEVFIKNLHPALNELQSYKPEEIAKVFYPNYYDGRDVKKFIVPIKPEYHEKLFGEREQSSLFEFSGGFIVEENTIRKAYLSQSQIKKVSNGDILLFYRSSDLQAITTIGIVENVFKDLKDPSKISEIVGKRTVYSQEEIQKLSEKPTLVILFIMNRFFPEPLKLNSLKEMGVLTSAPQSIQEIRNEDYLKLKQEGGIDESFTIH